MYVAALGDLHVRKGEADKIKKVLHTITQKADFLILSGDLTDHGLPEEATALDILLSDFTIPVVGVLGNHDFESGQEKEVVHILSQHMIILDTEPVEILGIGVAGVKGFGGGFEDHMVEAWGEQTLKRFVYETISEALKLENALAKLRTKIKIVSLHYSPIRATLRGEPPEIFPFLGSSRLAQPIDNFGVTVVFHGHAHYGSPGGKTTKGVPVYNVAFPLLQRISPKQPYALIEV